MPIKQYLSTCLEWGNLIFWRVILLSPVLWAGWNYGAVNFLPWLPTVDISSAIIFFGAYQIIQLFCLHKVEKTIVPVLYVPVATEQAAPEIEVSDDDLL